MSAPPPQYGLYYPYFHVRDERWLKLAALYWSRMVRIVPEDYPTRDSETVRVLRDEADFIRSHSPGRSVGAASEVFLAASRENIDGLRARYAIDPDAVRLFGARGHADGISAIHCSQVRPDLAELLAAAGLAIGERLDLSSEVDRSWLVMREELVAVYTSVLAEDFAAANHLVPATDQPFAYTVTGGWCPDRIASALLDDDHGDDSGRASQEVSEAIAVLALDLVVPADLAAVPIGRIVDVRRRFGAEFIAFRALVDQTVAELAALHDVRDDGILHSYVEDVVAERFKAPLTELRRLLAASRLEVATTAINVKMQIPASALVASGAWLAGHPVVAGTAMASVGLLAVGHGARRQRESIHAASPVASYLLHVRETLENQTLLLRTLRRLQRVAGL